jgi:cbb3-type cytochrome oxidase maturation protein
MTDFFYLIPIALALGAVGLAAFLWSLKSGQYEDLDGAAARILSNEDDNPIVKVRQPNPAPEKGEGFGKELKQ